MTTIAELLAEDPQVPDPALITEDDTFPWDLYTQRCAERASLLTELCADGPFHVGVLLDNVPEFPMWLGGAALAGATVVGINPTRRGDELARDIRHTDCQLLVTEAQHRPLIDGLDTGVPPERVLDIDRDEYRKLLAPHEGAAITPADVDPKAPFLLLFTSGTSGAPKAVIVSQSRLAVAGQKLAEGFELGGGDVIYEVMPLYHSNALFAGWSPFVAGRTAMALRRRFSASGFLPDVRKFRATYFNYVGKPLAYILATPEQPDDADNPLRWAFGNEAAERDIHRFGQRFGCIVVDNYGSTEGGAVVLRYPDQPPGSLGKAEGGISVRDSDTGKECPPARFDHDGRLLNPEEAIGELVSESGAATFEGYWKNEEADRERLRDNAFWTGDLAYADEDGWVYFAGRGFDWLRVDGENFAAAPVERILARHPDVAQAAVYAVPDADVGDQVMAALVLEPHASFDPDELARFLEDQTDLGTKWAPRYLRVMPELPATPTNKVLKRVLRAERWEADDPVWWRPERHGPYAPITDADRSTIRQQFADNARLDALEAV